MIDPREIINLTELYYHLKTGTIISRCRERTIVEARAVAVYVTSKFTEYSTTELGKYYFFRDHSTILHNIKKINKEISLKRVNNCSKAVDFMLTKYNNTI